MFGDPPARGIAVHGADQGAVVRKVCDQYPEPTRAQSPAVVVEQVYPVGAQEVGFDGLGVLGQERVEGDPSPRLIPVCAP